LRTTLSGVNPSGKSSPLRLPLWASRLDPDLELIFWLAGLTCQSPWTIPRVPAVRQPAYCVWDWLRFGTPTMRTGCDPDVSKTRSLSGGPFRLRCSASLVSGQSESVASPKPIRSGCLRCSGVPQCSREDLRTCCPSHHSPPDAPERNPSLRSRNGLLQMHTSFHREPGSKRRLRRPPRLES